jgi:hypothetical protein
MNCISEELIIYLHFLTRKLQANAEKLQELTLYGNSKKYKQLYVK